MEDKQLIIKLLREMQCCLASINANGGGGGGEPGDFTEVVEEIQNTNDILGDILLQLESDSVTPANIPSIQEVGNSANTTLATNTYRSVAIACVTTGVTVTINGTSVALTEGMTMAWEATETLSLAITVTNNGTGRAIITTVRP